MSVIAGPPLPPCLGCHRPVPPGRVMCTSCHQKPFRGPQTEWGKARQAERESRAEATGQRPQDVRLGKWEPLLAAIDEGVQP